MSGDNDRYQTIIADNVAWTVENPVRAKKEVLMTFIGNGSYKFYRMLLSRDGKLVKQYGRIGTTQSSSMADDGEAEFVRMLKEKLMKGYRTEYKAGLSKEEEGIILGTVI
jgi:predicted DNA-binding WGR domain protein